MALPAAEEDGKRLALARTRSRRERWRIAQDNLSRSERAVLGNRLDWSE